MNNRAIALLIGMISAILGLVALLVDRSTIGLATSAVISTQNDGVHAGSGTGDVASTSPSTTEPSASQASVAEEPDNQQLALASERISSLESELKTLRAELSSPPEERSALTDPESQLYSEAYFRVALDARIAAARRHLRPVAIALLDVNEGPASSLTPVPPARAAESIRQTIRDADTACRLSDGTFAIILEDTPENGAVWTVERVRRNLVSRFGNHTMWAGVACYPAHAFSTDDLLAQANEALVSAREWQQDRIEVAISE